MNIRFIFPAIISLMIISSCENSNKKNNSESITDSDIEYSPTEPGIPTDETSREAAEEDSRTPSDTNPTEDSQDRETTSTSATVPSGSYIKIGEESDNNCECYCIELEFSANSELCLSKGSLYISTRMERNQDNSIDIYLVGPSAKNAEEKDIPWKDFDTSTPIATIIPQKNGELELDWIGFMINGELAMDYAIYGKKTLEGNYKKN